LLSFLRTPSPSIGPQICIIPVATNPHGVHALFRHALFRQALFRQALFRHGLFRHLDVKHNASQRKGREGDGGKGEGEKEAGWIRGVKGKERIRNWKGKGKEEVGRVRE